ncbi:aldehyde dehydrogenase (NAD(P)(+)) ald5 [Nowakowskiella sp. JEL0078]|nr:aldehyde dehydrogenase (NAD(P)(+)) ald5 [Nowakowskiella sp. JEL0078]
MENCSWYNLMNQDNYLLLILILAIAAGNVVVLKSSEKTPLTALLFAQYVREAGFPPGVINILSGFGPTAGHAISSHGLYWLCVCTHLIQIPIFPEDISKVSFTGSTAVGKKIMEAAAKSNLKKVSLELGGKSPNIIFNDCILNEAVDSCIAGFAFNQGQVCCAGTRVFVQEGIYDSFIKALAAKVVDIKVGPNFEESTKMGPLVDKIQFDRVLGYLKIGKEAGAKVVCGGERVGTDGFFVAPTIFSDVKDDMQIVKEEIFGPVIVISTFKTAEEVIERANATPYGLAASVHTSNLTTAIRLSDAIQAGTVWVNTHNVFNAAIPFGGFKQSGAGRDGGLDALKEYTQVKAVIMKLGQVE